jgi:glycosyltransferase involved in cell wall biosynthesis
MITFVRRTLRFMRLLAAIISANRERKKGVNYSKYKQNLCIITEAGAEFGGAEVHTIALMKAIVQAGYKIDLICCRHSVYDERIRRAGWSGSVNIMHTSLSVMYNDRRNDKAWRALLRPLRGRLVIFPKGWYDQGGIFFLLVCKALFEKVVVIEHLEAPAPTDIRKPMLQKLSVYAADRVIAVSEKVGDRLSRDWGCDREKITVIKNGVPWWKFCRSSKSAAMFRLRYSVASDVFVFGMIARLNRAKGVDIALRALRLVLDRKPSRPVKLVVAGTGNEWENLHKLADGLEITRHVIFVGFVDNPAEEVISGFDSILFSSREEGLPLALLESMSAGCVPVVTRVGGMPEVVNSPAVGWVVGPESPEELCSAMLAVLAIDPETLSNMRYNAIRRVQAAFDIRDCHRKILQACGL